jgi:hypothetical protein
MAAAPRTTAEQRRGCEPPPTLAEGVDLLDAFTAAARARHDAEVGVVRTLGVLVRAGVIEALEHLPIDIYLSIVHRYSSAERHMLLDASHMLADMPATMRLWTDGLLSWSRIRSLVTRLRRFGRPLRMQLDARMAASDDVLDLADADRFDALVDRAILDLRPPDDVADEEAAGPRHNFLAASAVDDRTTSLYAELDPLTGATVVNAIDAQAARDTAQHGDRRPDGKPMTRGQRRARALANLCADSLAGRTGRRVGDHNGRCCARRSAKPTVVVHVPLDRISESASGLLDVAIPAYLPTLAARTVEAHAADADVRVVIFNGHRPLMVTRQLTAEDIPEDTRLAVQARDLGARDPGGRTTVGLSDVHHLGPDRTHDPDHMAVVSPRGHHRLLHRHGWTGTLDATSGELTWTHPTGRRITTQPWSIQLRAGD